MPDTSKAWRALRADAEAGLALLLGLLPLNFNKRRILLLLGLLLQVFNKLTTAF